MMIEMMVASSPAPTPISSEARALTTSWAKTSCPIWVVPSRWRSDGGASSMLLSWFGLPTKNGPMIPTSTKNPTMHVPTTSRGDRKAARSPVSLPVPESPASATVAATTFVAVTGTTSSAGR